MEEESIKKKTEREEVKESEDSRKPTDEKKKEINDNKREVEYTTPETKNTRLTSSEFEVPTKELSGKDLRRRTGSQEVKKDFYSLHKYYYEHINTVMQKLESGKSSELNLFSRDLLNPEKQKHLNSLSQDRRNIEGGIRLSDAPAEGNEEKNAATEKLRLSASPPIKTRKTFLSEEPSSLSQGVRRHSSSRPVCQAFCEYCHPPNNYILPAINCPERLFKVVFVGDSGVGKTSFIHRFCYDQFLSSYHATVGVDYRVKTFAVDGHLIALQLWDTAGQERYRSISKQYFRKTDGAIFMYDVTSELSFRNVRNWMTHTKENSESNIVSAVVGNKKDLSSTEELTVPRRSGEEFAKKNGSLFYETSCKTGEGLWDVLSGLARALQVKEDKEIEKVYELHKIEETKKCC